MKTQIKVPVQSGKGRDTLLVDAETSRNWTTFAVHQAVDGEKFEGKVLWTVTHAKSGFAICTAPGRSAAVEIARSLAKLDIDWTVQNGQPVNITIGQRGLIRNAVLRHGGWFGTRR